MTSVAEMDRINKEKAVTGVRRRVYCFGIICMLLALGQIVLYMVMFTFSISEDYSDYQVAGGSCGLVVLTSIYLGFSGRVLFLLYERRYEEAKGPEWLWWYSSLAVVLFNLCLVVWFGLLSDIIPATVCGVSAIIYVIFFKFASTDIKHISDNDSKAKPRNRTKSSSGIDNPTANQHTDRGGPLLRSV